MAEKTFTWKAEVEFRGTAEEFNKMAELLNSLPVQVRLPKWPIPLPYPGLIPIPVDRFRELSGAASADSTSIQELLATIQGIRGGIREPHMHIGDAIVFLDRGQFQKVLSETVSNLAVELAGVATDFVDVANAVQPMQAAVASNKMNQ